MKQTGKLLAGRIDRHYYSKLDPYVRWKRIAGIGGLTAGILYSLFAFSSWGATQISPGVLSHAHSAWNNHGCEVCHTPNAPIRPDAWGGRDAKNVALSNQQCNSNCHSVADHFANRTSQQTREVQGCVECHREHRGKDFSLVALASSSCTRCHARIDESSMASEKTRVKLVTDFTKHDGHPEFRSLSEDPGTIKFSHIQHLRPGQPTTIGDRTAKDFANLEVEFRERYTRGQPVDLQQLVQLNCMDCHERDSAVVGYENTSTALQGNQHTRQPTNNHRLFKPVSFQKHCIACHRLKDIPHGLNREQMAQAVKKLVSEQQIEYLKKLQERSATSEVDIPAGELTGLDARLSQIAKDEQQCAKCHVLAPQDNQQIVAPSRIPQRWFKHAAFSHGSHLMVECKACHPMAFETTDEKINAVVEAKRVMIEGIESCRACHLQDPSERAQKFSAGTLNVATADCVDCHRYHVDAPHPVTTTGAVPQTGISLDSVRDFLARGGMRW